MKTIFAYENKLKGTDDFLPNGMTYEQYIYVDGTRDISWVNQFAQFYLNLTCEDQGINIKKMLIKDAIESDNKFIIPLETLSHPYVWLGFETQDGKELFSFFQEQTLDAIRSKQATLLIHGATEGYDGVILNQVITILNLQCRKYKIPVSNVVYVTSDMTFEGKYKQYFKDNYFRGTSTGVKVRSICHFWEVAKALYSHKKDEPESLSQLSDLDLIKDKKYLCFNKGPRAHRYLVASHLWNNYKDEGLLSMPRWIDDHGESEFRPWANLVYKQDIPKYKVYITKFKEDLPLFVDREYKLGSIEGGVTWLTNSWPYKKTLFNITTETSFDNKTIFLTEKTFKLFPNLQPFIIVGDYHSLHQIKQLGFQTFHPFINESYDNIKDNKMRMKFIIEEIDRLLKMPLGSLKAIVFSLNDRLIHNYNHFWKAPSYTNCIIRRINETK